MASLLRRAALIAAPIFARSISSSSTRIKTSIARHLSSSSSSSDSDLLKVLDSEIKFGSQDYKQPEKLPKGFPFAIKDEKGSNVIFLKRSYRNERIEVLVSMPNLVPGEVLDDNDDDDSNEGNNDDEGGEFSIPLTVNISKGTGSSLELCCTAYPNEIEIDTICLRRNENVGGEEMFAYGGPYFNHLDKKLQNALHNCIEKRGISPITTNLLYEYMINKDNREFLMWLKNLRRFIEK